MKKISSILLTCALLLTALVLPGSAETPVAEGAFQGFEDFNRNLTTPFSLVDKDTESGNVHTGSKALKVEYPGGTIALSNLTEETGYQYTAGKWYKVSVWVKAASMAGNVRISLYECSISNVWDKENGVRLDHDINISKNTVSDWQEYTFTFQAKYPYYGLWIDGYQTKDNIGTSTFYLDDLKISPCYSLSAASENEELGTAAVSESKAAKGDTVTFTAAPAGGCSFIGWYDADGVLVSNDAAYETTVTGDLGLTAKFFSGVVQDFENWPERVSLNNNNNGSFAITETVGRNNSKALKVDYKDSTIAQDLTGAAAYNYKLGEWYKVSIWVKPESITGTVCVNVAEHDNSIWGTIKTDHIFIINTNTKKEWQKISFTFKATYTCYGLRIYRQGKTDTGTFYLDDLKIEKVSAESLRQDEIESAFTFDGTAIRAGDTTVKQALRFKTTVDNRILAENALSGDVTITEYGFVVLNKELLNGAELTLESAYIAGEETKTAPQKPAYKPKDDTDIVFEQNGNLKTFTAALTGIDDARYNTEYAVRVYVKLSNNEVHYAGETQYMSVLQCAALAFDANGDAYTDTENHSWKETYETRSYLYEQILKGKTVDEKTYSTAPPEAKQAQ